MRGRRVHDVDPDWQRQFPTKCAAINFLRLVESSPDRASEVTVVTRKKRVRKIVGRSGFPCGRKLFETKFSSRSFAGAGLQCIRQTGMNFVSGFGFEDALRVVVALRFPNDVSVFFIDPLENVRCIHARAAVWKYRVGESELGQCDFAAPKQCRRIWAKAGTNSGRSTKLQDLVEPRFHSDPHGGAVLWFRQRLPRG